MAQSLYLNNGGVFTVSEVAFNRTYATIPARGTGFGLAAGEPSMTWINLLAYITDDMIPHSTFGTYGLIYHLTSLGSKTDHAEYVDLILANGAFVWGDIYNGGLYVYKWSNTYYGVALFCGYGVLKNNENRDIFYVKDFSAQHNMTATNMKAFCIIKELNQDSYSMRFGGTYEAGGVPVGIYAAGVPIHENPADPEEINSINYAVDSGLIPLASMFSSNEQYIVNPLSPSVPSFVIPSYMGITRFLDATGDYPAGATFIDNSQSFDALGYTIDDNYYQNGSWWGGDGNIVKEDPNKGKTNSTGGGYGTPSNHSDDVGLPSSDQFTIDATSCGFVTIFNPTAASMLSFNQWLFASFTESWWDTFKKILQDPLDFVIGAGIVKHKPTVKLAGQEIKFNGIGTEVFADIINQWDSVDCGSVSITEQFASYLDYNGFSDVKIFLPFCGIQSLDVNDVMGATIHVIYYIDNMTGSCLAHVNVNRAQRDKADDSRINSVLYKFSGNVMQQLPLTNKDYASMISAVTSLATSAVAAASTGGAASLGLASQVAGSLDHIKPTIQRSGNLGSNYGMMDYLKPYLILERPIRSIPAEYGSYVGYPSAVTTRIGMCKGFTKGRPFTNWASNIHATDAEKTEIKSLIEEGIYI